jgi:cytochrome c biogenesis protein CcmG/thiol:disulfide interchange protein DsbE
VSVQVSLPVRLRAIGALVAVVLVLSGCSAKDVSKKPSDQLPEVTLASLEGGKPVDLSSLRGPMVINLWASWCAPCRKELPKYQAFAEKYAGKVDVLGIDFQETRPAAARQLAHETGVDYPLLADPDGRLHALGLPKLILLDAKGRVAHAEYVEITSVAQLERLVKTHLETS